MKHWVGLENIGEAKIVNIKLWRFASLQPSNLMEKKSREGYRYLLFIAPSNN